MNIFRHHFFIVILTIIHLNTTHASQNSVIPDWQPCFQESGQPFECTTVQVPLKHPGNKWEDQNHDDQSDDDDSAEHDHTMIGIAMIRLPATDPERRIGSLFLNPGGPGASGITAVVFGGPILFTAEVRARFDLIGFDPRGIGTSNALTCFRTEEEHNKILAAPPFPISHEELYQQKFINHFFAKTCRRNASPILNYMTTADVARDMDLLREAVGDTHLTFAGASYGSFLGITYANLFPERVRAIMIDGVLDPIAWTTGRDHERFFIPVTTRLGSHIGTMDTLNEFFRLCDTASSNCSLANNAANRFAAIAESLSTKPQFIILPDGSEHPLAYANFIELTAVMMYSSNRWPDFASFLFALETGDASPKDLGNILFPQRQAKNLSDDDNLPQSIEGNPGVLCSDSNNPHFFRAWPFAAEFSEVQNGYFGSFWTWISGPCLKWRGPKRQRYAGPFNHYTENPILVVNTLYDPTTPYEGALIVNDLMPNSGLLTVEGWGHTTLFLSQCATQAISDYLIEAALPDRNIVCPVDTLPFSTVDNMDDTARQSSKAQENRARIMKHLIPEHMRRFAQ